MSTIRAVRLCAAVVLLWTTAAMGYSGSLCSAAGDIDGSGVWLRGDRDGESLPVVFSWRVTQNADLSWRYEYALSVYRDGVQNVIIETPHAFSRSDMFDPTGPFGQAVVAWHRAPDGNPFIPADTYGIRFYDVRGTLVYISFDTWRRPVWGDFYACSSNAGGVINTAWNRTFDQPDPTVEPHDGHENFHILVPDTPHRLDDAHDPFIAAEISADSLGDVSGGTAYYATPVRTGGMVWDQTWRFGDVGRPGGGGGGSGYPPTYAPPFYTDRPFGVPDTPTDAPDEPPTQTLRAAPVEPSGDPPPCPVPEPVTTTLLVLGGLAMAIGRTPLR